MIVVTLLNVIMMMLEVDYAIREPLITLYRIFHEIFTGLYTFEFILKLYVESFSYFKSAWNIYDVLILFLTYFKLAAYVMRANSLNKKIASALFSTIRGIRMFRIIRTISFLKELKIILLTLLFTFTNSVLNVILVTALFVLICSVVANAFFAIENNSNKSDWNTLSRSVWSLFRFICCDDWPTIQQKIDDLAMSRILSVVFVFIGNFIFKNIFVGLIINNISDAQDKYKSDNLEEKKKLIKIKKENISRKQIEDLNKLIKKDNKNSFNIDEFKELLVKYRNSINHEDIISTLETSSNLTWIKNFYKTLSCFDNNMMFLKNSHYEMGIVLASIIEDRLKNTSKI
jgi:hypothetical protein